MIDVKAVCSVDELGNSQFSVHVWGHEPFAHSRTYTIKAGSDNSAAQEGIRMFVEEMECLHDTVAKEE